MINYACHGVVLGPDNLLFSADYPGYATRILENALGNGLTAMFTNGTAGNINPRRRGSFQAAQALGMTLAGAALKAAERAYPTDEAVLHAVRREVYLPLKPLSPVETLQESITVRRAQIQASEQQGSLPEDMSGLRGELIQLGHQLHMAKELQRLERPEDLEALRKCTEIQGFAVDNVAFISVPGEVFVEIGLAIRQRSPFDTTVVIGYANDISVSYVPTATSYEEGGYEPNWAIVDRGAAQLLEEEASALLQCLHEEIYS
jgi:hypothetical protein